MVPWKPFLPVVPVFFVASLVGGVFVPGVTAMAVLTVALVNAIKISIAFFQSKKTYARDFSLMAAGEVLVIMATVCFAVFAELGLLNSERGIGYANQMRLRIFMGLVAAYSTHRFYARNLKP
jgi:hypothetical protein